MEEFGSKQQKLDIEQSQEYLIKNKDLEDKVYSERLIKYVSTKLNIFLALFSTSYQFEIKQLDIGNKKGPINSNPYDRFDGKLTIAGNNKGLGSFAFKVISKSIHGFTELVSENSTVKINDHREGLNASNIFTVEDLLRSLKQGDKEFKESLYKLYASGLLTSNEVKIEFLETIVGLKEISEYIKPSLFKILGEISWDDSYTAAKAWPALQELLKRNELNPDVFKGIRAINISKVTDLNIESLQKMDHNTSLYGSVDSIKIGELNALKKLDLPNIAGSLITVNGLDNLNELEWLDVGSLKVLPKFPGSLKTLEFSHSGDIEEIELQNLPRLQELSVYNSKIKRIKLNSLGKLKVINFDSEVEEIDMQNIPELESICLKGSEIINIKLNNLPNLQNLDLSRTKNLKKVELQEVKALKTINLSRSSIEELPNLPVSLEDLLCEKTINLKTADIKDLPALQYLDFSDSNIQTIKIGDLPALIFLDLSNTNNLITADIDDIPALQTLIFCYSNSEAIKIGALTALSLLGPNPPKNLINVESDGDMRRIKFKRRKRPVNTI